MKTFRNYDDVPKGAAYLGSEQGGVMYESLADDIAAAIEPARLIEDDAIHYFDLKGQA